MKTIESSTTKHLEKRIKELEKQLSDEQERLRKMSEEQFIAEELHRVCCVRSHPMDCSFVPSEWNKVLTPVQQFYLEKAKELIKVGGKNGFEKAKNILSILDFDAPE